MLFAIAILIFQISCQKQAISQNQNSTYILPPATTSTLGGVIVGNGLSVTANGTLSATSTGVQQLNKIVFDKYFYINNADYYEIWISNYDGTGQQKVNITLPSGFEISGQGDARLSPDGKTLFFQVWEKATNKGHIYACNVDGSNAHKVVDGSNGQLSIGSAN